MYGVERVVVEADSLARHGLEAGDLLIDVDVLASDAVAALMEDADVVLSF